MGGRGSESVRRESGGGLDPSDIKNVSSLISEREGKAREVDEVLSVLRDFNERYNDQVGDIVLADITGRSVGVLGYCDGTNIGINRSFFNTEKLNRVYDEGVKDGYHPSRGNKSALEAVVSHEIGHHLTEVASKNMGMTGFMNMDKASDRIVNEARTLTKHRGVVQMASKISRYATSSNAEAVAEAVADVYCNGGSAKAESKVIVQVLNGYL